MEAHVFAVRHRVEHRVHHDEGIVRRRVDGLPVGADKGLGARSGARVQLGGGGGREREQDGSGKQLLRGRHRESSVVDGNGKTERNVGQAVPPVIGREPTPLGFVIDFTKLPPSSGQRDQEKPGRPSRLLRCGMELRRRGGRARAWAPTGQPWPFS
jgi:hypothetical protein